MSSTQRHPRTEPDRPRWLFVLDRVSVACCGLAWLAAVIHVAPAFFEDRADPFLLSGALRPGALIAIVIGLLLGYLLADLVSGTVHWLADRYFDPATPILGPALIEPFREHHDDPLAMTRHDFFEVSGNNGLVTIPVALMLCVLPTAATLPFQIGSATIISLGLAVLATNQLHCWAHVRHAPRFVRQLQRAGLILSPSTHAQHHRREHDRAYCVTSGWLNPALDRIQFFARLESVIDRFRPTPAERP